MHKRVRQVNGKYEVSAVGNNGDLLICAGSTVLLLPSAQQMAGVTVYFVPKGKSKVTIRSGCEESVIDIGDGPKDAVAVKGQNGYSIVGNGSEILVCGAAVMTAGKLPEPDPVPDDEDQNSESEDENESQQAGGSDEQSSEAS